MVILYLPEQFIKPININIGGSTAEIADEEADPKSTPKPESKPEPEEPEEPEEVTSVYSMEEMQWQKLIKANDTVLLKAFLTSYPNGKYHLKAKEKIKKLRTPSYRLKKIDPRYFKVIVGGLDSPRIAKVTNNVFSKVKIFDDNLASKNYFEIDFQKPGPYQLSIEGAGNKKLNINFKNHLYYATMTPKPNSKDYELHINGGEQPYRIDFFRAGKEYVERIENITDTSYTLSSRLLSRKDMTGRYEVRVYDNKGESWVSAGDIVVQPPSQIPFLVWIFLAIVLSLLAWGILKHVRYETPSTAVLEGEF